MVEAIAKNPGRGAFRVVGIGVSAGGLPPTTELLRHLGPQPAVAVIIFHHLDPTHESSLVEICSRVTPLPVETAVQGVQLQADHVYVVPPNVELELHLGSFVLSPRVAQPPARTSIDRFFESLADDCQARAVGVLSSGSGSDGARGLLAIKAEGRLTLAQDASAECRSMPESAVAAGGVDLVLPPQGCASSCR